MKPRAQAPPKSSAGKKGFLLLLGIVAVGGLFFFKWNGGRRGRSPEGFQAGAAVAANASPTSDDASVISALVTAEETCLALSRKMNLLSKSLPELHLPGSSGEAAAVFAPSVAISDLGPPPAAATASEVMLEAKDWPLAKAAPQSSKVDLWRPLFDAIARIEHAKVFIVTGEHPGGNPLEFEATAGFDALAQMKAGEWRSFQGKIHLSWSRTQDSDGRAGEWQITRWKTDEMLWRESPKRLFVEALDTALRTPDDVAKLRRSLHYEATVKYYRDGMKTLPHPYFAPISVNQKEGVAVADVDGDGFDDIYITVRLGKNIFLRNRGDGTFTEEAALRGLDLPGHTTCALFADFDNDGDLDVMLGRSLLRSSYLENRGGRFYQHPIPKFMPMAVISMAAADFNGDGLLDIYLCTYRPAAPMGASPAGGVAQVQEGAFDWPDEFFSPELAQEYKKRVAEHKQLKGGTV
ncbi:MAG TPA: VCBS repeat-containing protein, partial [Verrucomicrobiae bacterium]|nr:VCBS repeat-containing protein [Verrucomicrobiae bacterium]